MVLAALRALWAFLGTISWKVWAVLGAFVAVVAYTLWIDNRAYDRGVRHTAEKYDRLRLEEREAQIKSDKAASFALEMATKRADEARVRHEAALQAAEMKRRADVAAIEGKFHAFVTPTQLARCPDVPRGFLRYWAGTAAFANGGENPAPPAAGAHVDDAPSGIPIPALAGTLAGQAGAYKACSERNASWVKYHEQVNEWAKEVNRILAGEQK